MAAPMPTSRPPRMPYDVAFDRFVGIVNRALESHGERWNDTARQAAVCTLFISARQDGLLCAPDYGPPNPKPTPKIAPGLAPRPAEDDLSPLLAESIRRARQGQGNANSGPRPVPTRETSDGAPATAAASTPKSSFDVMIRAFHEIEADLPPEVFSAVLAWHGVNQPEDFRPDQVTKAASCYVALKTARDQYRADQQITAEHFEAIEEGWR